MKYYSTLYFQDQWRSYIIFPSSHALLWQYPSVMPSQWPDGRLVNCNSHWTGPIWLKMLLLTVVWLVTLAGAMTPGRIAELRLETIEMFYHGFDNYMDVAFPEDEVWKPTLLYYFQAWPIVLWKRLLTSPAASGLLRSVDSRSEQPKTCRTERCSGKLFPHLDRQSLDSRYTCLFASQQVQYRGKSSARFSGRCLGIGHTIRRWY